MNERIKELMGQTLDSKFSYTWTTMDYKDIEKFSEKFAELIVRECLEQIDKIRDGCEADNENQQALGADWAGLAVARHFGVEE